MPDVEKMWQGLEFLYKTLFSNSPPEWLIQVVAWVLIFAILLTGVAAVLNVLNRIKNSVLELFPLFPSEEQKRRWQKRRHFADHIEHEIRFLNNLESWQEQQLYFTRLARCQNYCRCFVRYTSGSRIV